MVGPARGRTRVRGVTRAASRLLVLKGFGQSGLPQDGVGGVAARDADRHGEIPLCDGAMPNFVAALALSDKNTARAAQQFAQGLVELRRHLEHDSEKACPGLDPGWILVFGQNHAPLNTLRRGRFSFAQCSDLEEQRGRIDVRMIVRQ